jgi:hypothetical protein
VVEARRPLSASIVLDSVSESELSVGKIVRVLTLIVGCLSAFHYFVESHTLTDGVTTDSLKLRNFEFLARSDL